MPIALDPNRTYRYILKAEQGTASPTVFILRPMTARGYAEIQNMVMDDVGQRVGDLALLYLRACLVGVENFNDASGKPVAIDREANGYVKESWLESLSQQDRQELAIEAHNINSLTDSEKKG